MHLAHASGDVLQPGVFVLKVGDLLLDPFKRDFQALKKNVYIPPVRFPAWSHIFSGWGSCYPLGIGGGCDR